MKILTVLNARASLPRDRERYPADHELWPPGVAAIAFVITTPDTLGERLVAYAIDTEDAGRGLYSVEGPAASLPALIAALSDSILHRYVEIITGVGPGHPPQPPKLPPEFQLQPPPAQHHRAVALATIHHRTIEALENITA